MAVFDAGFVYMQVWTEEFTKSGLKREVVSTNSGPKKGGGPW